jgi:ribose/xylose/arabinose/galactoside ABC-type transport system permease subunit
MKKLDKRNLLKKIIGFREVGVAMALVILVFIFTLATPVFMTPNNLLNITRQISVISLIAIAMTMVIITGGIDLSVGSVIAMAGIITASCIKEMQLPNIVGIIMGVLVGVSTGMVNGLLIAYLNMPAFITTMGTMTVLRGLGYMYTQAYPIYDLPRQFKVLGQGYVGMVPIPTIIFIIAAIMVYILLRKTVFGRHIYAIGGNPEASKLAGIDVRAVSLVVYILSGLICGIAAVMQTARIGAGLPTIGEGFELDAIAAAVIGGTAMSGGSGTILGTIIGSILLGVLSNGLSLLDVDSYIMKVISGLVVILAVLIDQLRIIMSRRAQLKNTVSELNKAGGQA